MFGLWRYGSLNTPTGQDMDVPQNVLIYSLLYNGGGCQGRNRT